MGDSTVLILSILYGILFVFLFRNFYRLTSSGKCGILFIVCHFMYIVIYSLVPMLVHYYVYTEGQSNNYYTPFKYDNDGCFLFYLSFLFAIIGYQGFLKGYFTKMQSKQIVRSQSYSVSNWFICATISLVIGVFCFYLWTKVFGGPMGFMIYASQIRTGADIGINNPYTVYKRFVPLVQFANTVYWGLFLKKKNIFIGLFFVVSLIFSILYLLANDGRAPFIMHFASLVFLYYMQKKHSALRFSKNTMIKFAVAGCFTLFVTHNYERISVDYFNKDIQIEDEYDFDILSNIREEFSYTVRSNQAIFEYLEDNPMTFRLPIEIASGILGILPSSFRPKSIEKLEKINTEIWDKSRANDEYFGGRPPDLIVTGIYTMNIFGIFLLPFILGYILKRVEIIRNYVTDEFDNNIFYALCLYQAMRVISYTNFDGLMLNWFYILTGYCILKIVSFIFQK